MSGARQTIGKLRVHGTRHNDAALRLALARDLDRGFEPPGGLPPSAILLVRRLSDPLPGTLGAQDADQPRLASWRSALRVRLDELLRIASTPDQHGIVADGDAVLFAEEAQMIAALACTLMTGQAQPWWCKLLLRGLAGNGRARLRELLGRQPQQLPAVFDCLAQWGAARSIAATLTENDATDLTGILVDAYHLDAVSVALRRSEHHHTTVDEQPFEWPLADAGEITGKPDASLPWPEHWSVVPGRPRTTCLVGLALTVQRRPQRARTAAFARCLAPLWAGVPSSDGARPRQRTVAIGEATRPGSTRQRRAQVRDTSQRQSPHETERVPAPERTDTLRTEEPEAAKDSVEWISSFERAAEPVDELTDHQAVPAGLEETHTSPTIPKTDTPRHDRGDDAPVSPVEHDAPVRSGFVGAGVPTEWGGVLFLINLLDHLNVPGCFGPNWSLDERIGPWALLELTGCALFESAPTADALWAELAKLDGREVHELPGGADSSDVQPDYRVPADWVADAMPETEILWQVDDGRLSIWYRDEYVVFDGTADEQHPLTQVAVHLSRLKLPTAALRHAGDESPPQPARHQGWMQHLAPALSRWLSLVVPYLRHRLRLATGDSATDIKALLRCPGRLYVDRTHVDLVAGLDAINLTVRRAGLDRDPGWQPRYGRVIAFHFE